MFKFITKDLRFFAILLILFLPIISVSQDLSTMDLRTVKVDDLSDAAVQTYYLKARANNLSDEDVASLLLQRGMPQTELMKLQTRVKGLPSSKVITDKPTQTTIRKQNSVTNETYEFTLSENELLVAGSQVFNTPSMSFEPNLKLSTPRGYIIGPDDELLLQIYGQSEAQYKLTVSPDGKVTIPNVGPIYVLGLTIEKATEKIKNNLQSSIYSALATGATKLSVSLGNVRSIKVVAVGQVKKPGVYTVSSLATAFNLLYLCGGPSFDGSYREIQVVRNGNVVANIDVYKFLFGGVLSANIVLQENDAIYVPYYKKRVLLKGEVKKIGYYELKDTENLNDVLKYAGGLSDSAYALSVTVSGNNGVQRKVQTVAQSAFIKQKLLGGEEIFVGKVDPEVGNAITLLGAVRRPGVYDIESHKLLSDLLAAAGGLQPFAFSERITIRRTLPDRKTTFISVNAQTLVKGNTDDIALQPKDVVTVTSLESLRSNEVITIEGEVRTPKVIPFSKGITLKDAILLADGFTEAATSKRIEIGRRNKSSISSDLVDTSFTIASIIEVKTNDDLSGIENEQLLQPNDIIFVRTNPAVQPTIMVTLEGEFKYPGKYIVTHKGEKVSELITRAGGLTALGDIKSASLMRKRNNATDTILKANVIRQLSKTKDTTINVTNFNEEYDIVAVDMFEAISNPSSSENLTLSNGDKIVVPNRNLIVKVEGEVLQPSQMSFQNNRKMNYYIDRAGGFTAQAFKRKAFVVSANGNARVINRFLFIKSYPVIYPGDEIVVPPLPDRSSKRLSTGEIIAFSSALASLATVVLAILRN